MTAKGTTAREIIDQNGRDDHLQASDDDFVRCLSCKKVAAEDSGDSEVWQWRWADGWISTMPRGVKPRLCMPCARAAVPDVADNREP